MSSMWLIFETSKILDMCESRDKAFGFFIKIMLKSLIGNVFHLRRQFLGNGGVFSLSKRFLRQRSDEDSLCLLRNRWERSWGERKRALGWIDLLVGLSCFSFHCAPLETQRRTYMWTVSRWVLGEEEGVWGRKAWYHKGRMRRWVAIPPREGGKEDEASDGG